MSESSKSLPLVLDFEQGTESWKMARLGIVTASKFKDMMTNGRGTGSMGQTAYSYMFDLIAERLTNEPQDEINAKAIQWGNDNEANALRTYYMDHDEPMKRVGMVLSNKNNRIACSPDGIYQEPDGAITGGIEIKCPHKSRIHLQYIEEGGLPSDYKMQVHGCMWVTGAFWWDFVSYDPRMPEPFRLFVTRVVRDEEIIKSLEERSERFLIQMDERIQKLTKITQEKA